VWVYTYTFDIYKYTNDTWEAGTQTPGANFVEGEFENTATGGRKSLAGARFELYKNVTNPANPAGTGTKVVFRYNGISTGASPNQWNGELAGYASYMVNDNKLKQPMAANLNLSLTDVANMDSVNTTKANETNPGTLQTVLVSPASGYINVYGLDDGVYYLVEIEAPAGFHKLEAPVVITVGRVMEPSSTSNLYNEFLGKYKVYWDYQPHGRSQVESDGDSVDCIDVLNLTGPRLPGTGGIGTTIVIVAGILIIALFGTAIVTYVVVHKKRNTLNALKQ
jgi:hypothetical protein